MSFRQTSISHTGAITIIALLGLMIPARALAQDSPAGPRESKPASAAYAKALATFVNGQGMVDYRALKAEREHLDSYTQWLAQFDPNDYEKLTTEERIAFWINAYNGLTLQSIIDRYPVQKSTEGFPANSIRQIPGVWDKKKHAIMGAKLTLDEIEHERLRKEFDEPRIHMALVCAAHGCPSLRNEPYVGARLDAQLDDQSKKFFSHPKKFRIDRDRNTVYLSAIFQWFGSDFAEKHKTDRFQQAPEDARPVLAFALRHLSDEEAEYLGTQNYSVDYLEYDWSLNEQ